jgi:bifunctional DNA-binding transcriptional regulator/antitoxin component of YhaV-PrlF toxin-antitoxin module
MKATVHSKSVWFGAKGQIVIPRRTCREFRIEEGTWAMVTTTPEGILIKPMTSRAIARGLGPLKIKPGGRSFAERRAEHKREEIALEERKYGRGNSAR